MCQVQISYSLINQKRVIILSSLEVFVYGSEGESIQEKQC